MSLFNDLRDMLAREEGIRPVSLLSDFSLLVVLSDDFSKGTQNPLLRALFSTIRSLEGRFLENLIAFGSKNFPPYGELQLLGSILDVRLGGYCVRLIIGLYCTLALSKLV